MSKLKNEEQWDPLKDGTGKIFKGPSTITADSSATNTLKSNEAVEGIIEVHGKPAEVKFNPKEFNIINPNNSESIEKSVEDYLAELSLIEQIAVSAIGAINSTKDMKFDQGKPIAGAIQDFGLALMEVSALMTFGAKKYKRSSWTTVENGVERYTDAMMRHFFQESFEEVDSESGFAHDVAVAFSALARLELRLRSKKK